MNPSYLSVLIITLNYNQNNYTIECIHSLLKSDYNQYKILLIDNGSATKNYTDLVKSIMDLNDGRVILKRITNNLGYVGGINYGLKEGLKLNPDYFLIMNNDTIIDKSSISELVSVCLAYYNRAIVSGKVYWYDNPNVIQNTGMVFTKLNKNPKPVGLNNYDNGLNEKITERDMLDDIFWLFPVQLPKQIGFYSNDYWFNFEQADFAMRAKMAGYKLIYTPYAKIWHKSGVSIGGRNNNPIKAYFTTQSMLIYLYKHFNFFVLLFAYCKICCSLSKRFFLFLLGRISIKQALAIMCGIFYFHKWLLLKNNNTGKIPSIIK